MTEATINIIPDAPTAAPTTAPAVTPAPEMTVEAARSRRNEILADKKLCEKLMAGDPDLRAEVSRLNQKISSQEIGAVVQSELTGIDPANPFSNITAPGILARHEYASAARDLVPLIGREAYEALVAGRLVVPKSKYDEAVWRKEYNMSDPEWMANYRAGSKAHRDQMRKILIVLGAKVAG